MSDHASAQPLVRSADEGEALWVLGGLMQIKANGEDTHQAYEVHLSTLPPGFAPPPHIHHAQDELFFVLDGTAMVRCGDRPWDLAPGALALLPRGVPHAFTVTSHTPLSMLVITSPAIPHGYHQFITALGEPAQTLTIPPPAPPDIPRLVAVSAAHALEYVPPLDEQLP